MAYGTQSLSTVHPQAGKYFLFTPKGMAGWLATWVEAHPTLLHTAGTFIQSKFNWLAGSSMLYTFSAVLDIHTCHVVSQLINLLAVMAHWGQTCLVISWHVAWQHLYLAFLTSFWPMSQILVVLVVVYRLKGGQPMGGIVIHWVALGIFTFQYIQFLSPIT